MTTSRRFGPNARLARWLRTGVAGEGQGEGEPDWDGWLLRRMSQGEIVTVGGLLVDRQVLRQRFACVAERCAPLPGRGGWRSCCADVAVPIELSEQRRIHRFRGALEAGLTGLEPRLPRPLRWVEDGCLARPEGRCVFSGLDARGRIRCHLHAFARGRRMDRSEVQPLGCRLFPLVVVDFGASRTALTLVSASTWRLAQALPPRRYPCLSDPTLPRLVRSLRSDLDWAFGSGFARAIERVTPDDSAS